MKTCDTSSFPAVHKLEMLRESDNSVCKSSSASHGFFCPLYYLRYG